MHHCGILVDLRDVPTRVSRFITWDDRVLPPGSYHHALGIREGAEAQEAEACLRDTDGAGGQRGGHQLAQPVPSRAGSHE